MRWLLGEYGISDTVVMRLLVMAEELESEVGEGEVVLVEDQLRARLSLPFPWVVREVLHRLNLAST